MSRVWEGHCIEADGTNLGTGLCGQPSPCPIHSPSAVVDGASSPSISATTAVGASSNGFAASSNSPAAREPDVAAKPFFPRVIDSTMRTAFLACPQKFKREFIDCLRPMRPNVHLHYGACFAKGLEVAQKEYYGAVFNGQLADAERCIARGLGAVVKAWGDFPNDLDKYKTLDLCVASHCAYFNKYPLGDPFDVQPLMLPDRTPAVECRLWMRLPDNIAHPDGGHLYYAGRFDALVVTPQAVILARDEKTTKQMGENWAAQWKMRGQFKGYTYLARAAGFNCQGMLTRGVCARLDGRVELEQVPVLHAEWQLQQWYGLLLHDIQRMLWHYKNNYWPLDGSGESCNAYGGCPFRMLCDTDEPEAFVETNYRREVWNPLEERPQ